MVWFEMLHYEIVWFATVEAFCQVLFPFLHSALVRGVHDSHFLIHDEERVVAHALWYVILRLKESNVGIIATDIINGVCNFFHVYIIIVFISIRWIIFLLPLLQTIL